jgi:protein MpaA
MTGPRGRGSLATTITIVVLFVGVVTLGLLLLLDNGEAGPKTSESSTGSVGTTTSSGAEATTSTLPAVPRWQMIGSSVRGLPIELYTFGSGSWRVLIIGGIHGDEYGGPVARKLLRYLEEHHESLPADAFVQLVPSANPDGEAADTRGNANKVDLNRNFPSQNWQSSLNAGDRPTSGLTGGTSPGSEPETKALLSILGNDWDLVISLHSSGGIVDPDGEGGLAIAERMAAISGMPVGALDYQKYITGSLGVFMPERYQVPVITLELESTELTDGIRDALLSALTGE